MRYGWVERPDEILERKQEMARIYRVLERMDEKDRITLVMRYGLEGDPLTYREISQRLGVTIERARQRCMRADRRFAHLFKVLGGMFTG